MEYNIYDLLDKIRKRPGMYLLDITLFNLDTFIIGYIMAMRDINAKDVSNPPFIEFTNWLEEKSHRLPAAMSHWRWIVLGLSLNCSPLKARQKKLHIYTTKQNHRESFNMFFELLDEYRSQKQAHL